MIAPQMARTRAPGHKHPRRSTDSKNDADSHNVRLRSRECEIFVVPKEAACRSMKVKRMVDANKDQPFWFKDISSNKLEKVMEFCQLVQDDTSVHAEFLSHLDEDALFSTMVNASDLEIKSLLDITVNAKPPRAQTVLYITTLPAERSSRPRTQSKDRGRARCLAAATLLGRGRFRRDRFGRIVRVSQLGACPRALSESATLSRTCAAPIWRLEAKYIEQGNAPLPCELSEYNKINTLAPRHACPKLNSQAHTLRIWWNAAKHDRGRWVDPPSDRQAEEVAQGVISELARLGW